jgi:hypothetical protein
MNREKWKAKLGNIWNDIIPVLWAHDMLQDWQEEVAALQSENEKLVEKIAELEKNSPMHPIYTDGKAKKWAEVPVGVSDPQK